jgi:hypothetical protein
MIHQGSRGRNVKKHLKLKYIPSTKQLGSATDRYCFRPMRGEMFIERATAKFLLAPAERNMSGSRAPLPETLRSAGAKRVALLHLEVEFT